MSSERPAAWTQLLLPLQGVDIASDAAAGIPRSKRVNVNRNLRMSEIDWVGFDMDYTLAIYRQNEMDALSVQATVERLVKRGYPAHLARTRYDTRYPIRGLLIDKRHGHVLKMDRYKVVQKAYHGMQRVGRDEVEALYLHRRIRPTTPRYHWIDTLFALSEVTAYAGIVDALERRGDEVDHARLFADIRESIDEAHRDGTVYAAVRADPARYIEKDPDLARTLHKLRSAGKKLFLLTNSPWHYTESVLGYLLDDALAEYRSWKQYFDVAIVSAQKPSWFQEGRPLCERDGDVLRSVRGPLERGKLYEGGSLREFERLVEVHGDQVLYVGDHIYGDILKSKKESTWRTAMIIQELDAEIAAHESCERDLARQRQLGEGRDDMENDLRFYQAQWKELGRRDDAEADAARVRTKRAIERIRAELRAIEKESRAIEERVDKSFHPYWGSLLKEQNEMSSFGIQVELYADIYTARVSCLGAYSPQQYFRSPYDLMPHEL